jgi:hypothetical protein
MCCRRLADRSISTAPGQGSHEGREESEGEMNCERHETHENKINKENRKAGKGIKILILSSVSVAKTKTTKRRMIGLLGFFAHPLVWRRRDRSSAVAKAMADRAGETPAAHFGAGFRSRILIPIMLIL